MIRISSFAEVPSIGETTDATMKRTCAPREAVKVLVIVIVPARSIVRADIEAVKVELHANVPVNKGGIAAVKEENPANELASGTRVPRLAVKVELAPVEPVSFCLEPPMKWATLTIVPVRVERLFRWPVKVEEDPTAAVSRGFSPALRWANEAIDPESRSRCAPISAEKEELQISSPLNFCRTVRIAEVEHMPTIFPTRRPRMIAAKWAVEAVEPLSETCPAKEALKCAVELRTPVSRGAMPAVRAAVPASDPASLSGAWSEALKVATPAMLPVRRGARSAAKVAVEDTLPPSETRAPSSPEKLELALRLPVSFGASAPVYWATLTTWPARRSRALSDAEKALMPVNVPLRRPRWTAENVDELTIAPESWTCPRIVAVNPPEDVMVPLRY